MAITQKEIDEPYIIRNGYVLLSDGSVAQIIVDPSGSGALRQIEKLNFDNTNQLRVVFVQPALVAGTANVGVVGTIQKLLANPYADTTTNLAAAAVYTGTLRNLQVGTTAPYYYYGAFSVLTFSDKTGTLYIDESADGSNWTCVYSVNTSEVTDSDGTTKRNVCNIEHKPTMRYARLKYKNTSGDTTTVLSITSRVIGKM